MLFDLDIRTLWPAKYPLKWISTFSDFWNGQFQEDIENPNLLHIFVSYCLNDKKKTVFLSQNEQKHRCQLIPSQEYYTQKRAQFSFFLFCFGFVVLLQHKAQDIQQRLYLYRDVVENLHWRLRKEVYYGLIPIMKWFMNPDKQQSRKYMLEHLLK